MMYKQYSIPVHELRTPPHKSSHYPPSAYYPQKYDPAFATPSPSPQHIRRASHEPRPTATATAYPSTVPLPTYMTYQETYSTPIRLHEPKHYGFAAQTDRLRTKAARASDSKPSVRKVSTPGKRDKVTVEYEVDPAYYGYVSPEGTPPPPYHDQRYAQPAVYHETYIHEQPSPPAYKTRTRAASTPQKPTRQPSTKAKKPAAPREAPKATAKDAAKAGIPEGYSLKNWDPTEEPILLLGSVFDANTLGKWIYDWTVFHHGAGAPMADHAGELWLSLIELASKMKRSEECLPRIKRRGKRELIDDFLDEGQNLLYRLDKILRSCEDFMWAAARRENGGKKTTSLGSSSGCAFVDSIFGRDRELENTEKLMADVRYWTHRFNTLCEPILRRPRD